jgi:lysozyme
VAGLVKRRATNADLIFRGKYPNEVATAPTVKPAWTISAEAADLLAACGYPTPTEAAVRQFQQANDLTVDGIVGPATLATLRRKAAAAKAKTTINGKGTAAGATVGAGTDLANGGGFDLHTLLWIGGGVALVVMAAWLIFWVWQNRGPALSRLPEKAKDWSADNLGVVIGRPIKTTPVDVPEEEAPQ